MTYQTPGPAEYISLSASARVWGDLIRAIGAGDLTYDTPYQRGEVWTIEQRMMLVYSVLSGTPIPALIVNSRPRSAWFAEDGSRRPTDAVIDGKQRLMTMQHFFAGNFAVPASWFPADEVESTEDTADGPYVRYGGLSRRQQRFFEMSATIAVAEASVRSVRDEAAIYLRVNGSGTMQTDEDMERAAGIAGQAT